MRGEEPLVCRSHGSKKDASFQVIVLGCAGGPREDTITGLLVRAPQTEWRKSSVIAVDAGAHLASIIRILELQMPLNSATLPPKDHECVLSDGPFAGLRFPNISAKANGLYFFRELLHSFLITHPHLDHLAGMGINTPALEYGREAKAIVALPSVIEAIKTHIFNDSIWPNLSDEGHGVGFVTYRRLIEGGNQRLGYGESRGYVNVCDGLATKCWSVSHGKCRRQSESFSHQREPSGGYFHGMGRADGYGFPGRRMSRMSDEFGHTTAMPPQMPRDVSVNGSQGYPAGPSTPGVPASAIDTLHSLYQPVDSSAFFIRNDTTGHEIIVFGDLEPDSVSLHPRNYVVWEDAAPKVAAGTLKAIFMECSYDDGVRDVDLYGHLCPRHLIAELTCLAQMVIGLRKKDVGSADRDRVDSHASLPMHLEEPPSPSTFRRKRKLVTDTVENGAPPTLIPQPSSTPPHVGIRSVSNTRRKTSHSPMARPTSPPLAHHHPLQPNGDDYSLSDDNAATPVMSPPPPLARSTAPQQQHQHHHHHSPYTNQRQSSLATDSYGSLQLAPPPSGAGTEAGALRGSGQPKHMGDALKGLTVHIIHVKDTLMDGPSPGEVILGQLEAHAEESGLGCEFNVTSCGQEIWV